MRQCLDEAAISLIFLTVGVYGITAYTIDKIWHGFKRRLSWLK